MRFSFDFRDATTGRLVTVEANEHRHGTPAAEVVSLVWADSDDRPLREDWDRVFSDAYDLAQTHASRRRARREGELTWDGRPTGPHTLAHYTAF